MREILLRGRRLDDGEWVVGYYFPVCRQQGKMVRARYYIIPVGCEFQSDLLQDNAVEVDPATVGQYTGLTDKNCMKIFEGDIVLDEESGYRYQVKWFQDYGCFGWANRAGHMEFEYADVFLDCMKVIGNIYDNLELLESGAET